MGYRYGIWYIDTIIYHIDLVILDIDMGYGLMMWEMTVSIWSSSTSIWDILSLCLRRQLQLVRHVVPGVRGLHSLTSQLNLSALYGIGSARKDCVARIKGVLGGV